MSNTLWKSTLAAGLLALLSACGGGADSGSGGTGTLRVALTDNPACGYDEVNVTVERVRVHASDSAGSGDGGWRDIPVDPPVTVDLLSLTNGVLEELGQTALPAGTYQQLRLVLSGNTGGLADRNWIVLSSDPAKVRVPLQTPSAQQSGLKLNTNIAVGDGQLADVVLDFDACKSVVRAGGSGQYLLKPVLRVIARTETGVLGQVSAALVNAGATVSLQQNGVVWRATTPANDGSFRLQPVEPGTYSLVVVAPGRATTVVRDLTVFNGQLVRASPLGEPIDPPASTTATFDGTVTVVPAPADIEADVALLQTISGAPVLLSERRADVDLGDYAFTGVALEAPWVGFHAGGASLTLAPDNAALGQFFVRAATGGASQTAGPLAPTPGATSTNDFTFN